MSQIAPYLTITIVIENLANPGSGMFLVRSVIIVKNRGKGIFQMRLSEGRCQPERPGAAEKPPCPYSASPIIPISSIAKIKTFA